MPSFYEKDFGAALSVTIDKFIYVIAHKIPNTNIKCMYDVIEEHTDINQMQHAITRETLKYYDIRKEITTASVSDIVTRGSGLGSSSAFTVGLVNALGHITNQPIGATDLAVAACEVEMNRCGYPVGKQDQYAAAVGGLNLFVFNSDGTVNVSRQIMYTEHVESLQNNLMLVYSGHGRDANNILQKQQNAMSSATKFDLVKKSRDKAFTGLELIRAGSIDDFGALLHDAWMDKKAVCEGITQDYFDVIYDKAMKAGALGGKLLGAGGGGFFLFYVPQERREDVAQAVTRDTLCKVYDFNFHKLGSEVVIK